MIWGKCHLYFVSRFAIKMDKFLIQTPDNQDKRVTSRVENVKRRRRGTRSMKKSEARISDIVDIRFPLLSMEENKENKLNFCIICRQHPTHANQKWTLFDGKVVDRRDTLIAHQLSAKHQACQLRETNSIQWLIYY